MWWVFWLVYWFIGFILAILGIMISMQNTDYNDSIVSAHASGNYMTSIGFDYDTSVGIYEGTSGTDKNRLEQMITEYNNSNMFSLFNGGSKMRDAYDKAKDAGLNLEQMIDITYDRLSIAFMNLPNVTAFVWSVIGIAAVWLIVGISVFLVRSATVKSKDGADEQFYAAMRKYGGQQVVPSTMSLGKASIEV